MTQTTLSAMHDAVREITMTHDNTVFDLSTPVLGAGVTYGQLYGDRAVAAAHQQPVYADPNALLRYMNTINEGPPLADIADTKKLMGELAWVAMTGAGYVLQAGLCAENIDMLGRDPQIYAHNMRRMTLRLKMEMEKLGQPVVSIGRFNQEKPRSNPDDNGVPAFRGTNINGPERADRAASLDRLSRGNALHARTFTALEREQKMHGDTGQIYTSNEALHMANKIAYLRAHNGTLYSGAAHMHWVGVRTNAPNTLQVRFAKMIANPVAVKIGPDNTPDDLARLVAALNPFDTPGRLTVIFRMGAKHTDRLRDFADILAGRPQAALVMLDPMHGNTRIDAETGYKTRRLKDIRREITDATRILETHGVRVDGLHLEVSPDNVTECRGNRRARFGKNYQSVCDPNLNPDQAVGIVKTFVKAQRQAMVIASYRQARGTGWALD